MGGVRLDLGINGKVAFVMGGSRGIGRAISLELARAGCKVAVVARGAEAIDETVQSIVSANGTAVGISADLSDLSAFDRVIEQIEARLGAPDIAIFNPPTPDPGAFLELTELDFAASFNNLVLCFSRMVRLVAPSMQKRAWGRIVTIGAACAKQPMRGQLNFSYAMANTMRLAAVSLSKTISFELAPLGITVNTIATGAIRTDMAMSFFAGRAHEAGLSVDAFMDAMTKQIPVGRIGAPEEMARLCAYLCSEHAGYTTGETILCDGGLTNCAA
jgi:3-oxoacyl-[acyl-carrier protein] reductase